MKISKLKLIVEQEYKTDITTKSFWIATFLVPLIFVAFIIFGTFMMDGSESFMTMQESLQPTPDPKGLTGLKVMGMLMGLFLVMFLMMYGSQIFNKVKVEKCNRIFEILATSVDGRTMMLAKIISVCLIGMTQLLIWSLLIVVLASMVILALQIDIPWMLLADRRIVCALFWSIAFFIGGYVFFGSLYAAVGAMTDKNNEYQEYVAVLTFLLLGSFYIGEYAVDNGSEVFVTICSFVPLTSPVVACVNAIIGTVPMWQSWVSLVVLYVFAGIALSFSGKLYTSSMLLRGKKFSPKDIITFLRAK
ncbi:MAG: ABC transporter permease [Clostridium sp.]|nr:ABC transporter permease [Prevotella sp.]MCM1429305.1 ABC transporter permease [Clostridium sp.]MCM1475662.1 ABC transporter permease [Muribaculaceae bacterium]